MHNVRVQNFHNFNLALLSKQAWRLQVKPDSLVARVFQARYFPRRDFFSAKLGANPSYTWRSLFATQNFLVVHARKRIGFGMSVKLFQDPWLLDSENAYVEAKAPDDLKDITVDAFRDEYTRGWDLDLFNNYLSPRDVFEARSVPLSNFTIEDNWFWFPTADGVLTVKSVYRLLMLAGRTVHMATPVDWNKIWSVDVPPKMRTFLWRAVSGCMPTKINLRNKRVMVDPVCPICLSAPEDELHALLFCSQARAVWNISPIGDRSGQVQSVQQWWNEISRSVSSQSLELAYIILWKIWSNRNDFLWNKHKVNHRIILRSSREILADHKSATFLPKYASPHPGQVRSEWSKPEVGLVKCNIDASVYSSHGFSGYGSIVKDSNGDFVRCMHGDIQGRYLPIMAEALSFREALSWLKRNQETKVVVESDCLNLVSMLNSSIVDFTPLGLVVNDCKILMLDFNHCDVNFVKRSANELAHVLARDVHSGSGLVEWVVEPPDFILM